MTTAWNDLRGTLPPDLMATRRSPLGGRAIIHVVHVDTMETTRHFTLCGTFAEESGPWGDPVTWADEMDVIGCQLTPWPDDAPVCRKCIGKLKKLRRDDDENN